MTATATQSATKVPEKWKSDALAEELAAVESQVAEMQARINQADAAAAAAVSDKDAYDQAVAHVGKLQAALQRHSDRCRYLRQALDATYATELKDVRSVLEGELQVQRTARRYAGIAWRVDRMEVEAIHEKRIAALSTLSNRAELDIGRLEKVLARLERAQEAGVRIGDLNRYAALYRTRAAILADLDRVAAPGEEEALRSLQSAIHRAFSESGTGADSVREHYSQRSSAAAERLSEIEAAKAPLNEALAAVQEEMRAIEKRLKP